MQGVADPLPAYVAQEIAERFRAVIVVTDVLPYAYTISDLRRNPVELIVLGSADEGIRELVHKVARMIPNNPPPTSMIQVAKGLKVKLVEASPLRTMERFREYRTPAHHETTRYPLRQIILPAPNGAFYGDRNCPPGWPDIPVIGT